MTDELMHYFYKDKHSIFNFQMKEGNFLTIEDVHNSHIKWQPFESGTRWGGRDYHVWFRTEIEVPTEFDNEALALYISTNHKGWDATDPQFKLFVDGVFLQGMDQNHRKIIRTKKGSSGDRYVIDLHAYSGMIEQKVDLYMDLMAIDPDVINILRYKGAFRYCIYVT